MMKSFFIACLFPIVILFIDSTNLPSIESPNLEITCPDTRYPILWSGQSIETNQRIKTVSFFEPLFGKDRKCVNPTLPYFKKTEIVFQIPGEYYLQINQVYFIKSLILSPEEPLSEVVVHIFDFLIANSLFSNQDEEKFKTYKHQFIEQWFRSNLPARITSGPLSNIFQLLIRDRLNLPTRKVNLPGIFKDELTQKIQQSSHTVTEVYLPDLKKWVSFDVTYNFMARWLDALELVNVANNSSFFIPDTGIINIYGLNIHNAPKSMISKDILFKNTKIRNEPFSSQEVTQVPVIYRWFAMRFYYSGASFFGKEATYAWPTGTEFLPGESVWAMRLTNPELIKFAMDQIKDPKKNIIVTQEELITMLYYGFYPEINRKEWLKKLPQKNER